MRNVAIGLLLLLLGGYLALCALMFVMQRSLLYFPQPGNATAPANLLALPSRDARVLVSTRSTQAADALIYFGGNAENVSASLPVIAAAFPGHALYLLHYRGYGGSQGKPTEAALVADALALYQLVSAKHRRVSVVGRSLGSGLALRVANAGVIERLVLVTPYDSLLDVASRHYPYFPLRWLMLDKFESWRLAPQVNAPTLIIQAGDDEVIPAASTEALAGRFKAGVARRVVIPGVGHNSISNHPRYLPLLRGEQ